MQAEYVTHTHSTHPWLPPALLVLAAAIVIAAFLIATSINAASQVQATAQRQATAAIGQASMLASNDAYAAQIAANNAAQHQANLAMLNQPQPSAIDRLTAANQAAMNAR